MRERLKKLGRTNKTRKRRAGREEGRWILVGPISGTPFLDLGKGKGRI